MQVLAFTETFAKLDQLIEDYNEQFKYYDDEGNPHFEYGKCIRPNHRHLMMEIIRCYAKQLFTFKILEPDQELPPFHANSVGLGKRTGFSDRTIRRLIKRLLEAGIIAHKEWRGRNTNYHLTLNRQVLIMHKKFEEIVTDPISPKNEKTCNDAVLRAVIKTTCPQIEAGELINKAKLSGAKVEKTFAANDKAGDKETGDVGLQVLAGDGIKAGFNASPADFTEVLDYVERLFALLLGTVLKRLPYLAESETFAAKKFFCAQLLFAPANKRMSIYKELKIRILIASKYLTNHPEYRPQIPSLYFKPENRKGFARTKVWYDHMAENSPKIEKYESRCKDFWTRWNAFIKATSGFLKHKNHMAYSKNKNWLVKKYPEMASAYDYVTLKLGVTAPNPDQLDALLNQSYDA